MLTVAAFNLQHLLAWVSPGGRFKTAQAACSIQNCVVSLPSGCAWLLCSVWHAHHLAAPAAQGVQAIRSHDAVKLWPALLHRAASGFQGGCHCCCGSLRVGWLALLPWLIESAARGALAGHHCWGHPSGIDQALFLIAALK